MAIARIPYEAAAGAEIDHTSTTVVTESAGGQAGRRSLRQQTIRNFHLTIMPEETQEVIDIFDTHRRRWPVAIRDWSNYFLEDEILDGEAAASTMVVGAPLRRKIMPSTGDRYLHQRILVPDEAEIPFIIAVDGTPLTRGDWDFDDFGNALIPTGMASGIITATGNYMVAACFVDDSLTIKVHVDGLISLPDVRLREILEPEMIALMAQTDDSI